MSIVAHVTTLKLGELFQYIRNGVSIKQGVPGGIPITRIETISDGIIDSQKMGYAGIVDVEPYEEYLIFDGDILMSHINSEKHLGKVAIAEGIRDKVIHGMNLLCLRAKRDILHPKFAYWFFASAEFRRQLPKITNKSVNQASFNVTSLKQLKMPVPPLDTQKRIADALDKAQELIDKRKQQIEMLDEFLQSVFLDIVGNPLTNPYGRRRERLGDIAEITMGQSPKGATYNERGLGVPLLNGPTEFGPKHPEERQWTTQPTRLCQTNDILFCVRGATAGRMNYADKQYCIGRGLASIRPKNQAHDKLIYLVLRNMYLFFQDTSDGSTFINIGKERLSNLLIPIIDQELLGEFSCIIEETEQRKAVMEDSLAEMENAFNSIMQRAFKGELFN